MQHCRHLQKQSGLAEPLADLVFIRHWQFQHGCGLATLMIEPPAGTVMPHLDIHLRPTLCINASHAQGHLQSCNLALYCSTTIQNAAEADRVPCPGQVPLSKQEAEALKASRQASANQDWLMEADSTSPTDAADTGLYQQLCYRSCMID